MAHSDGEANSRIDESPGPAARIWGVPFQCGIGFLAPRLTGSAVVETGARQ